jgi:hypothetical protein
LAGDHCHLFLDGILEENYNEKAEKNKSHVGYDVVND